MEKLLLNSQNPKHCKPSSLRSSPNKHLIPTSPLTTRSRVLPGSFGHKKRSSCGGPELNSITPKSNPRKSSMAETEFFPSWLLGREDFKQIITRLENIDNLDIGEVCEKSPDSRDEIDIKAIKHWAKRYSFFDNLTTYTMNEVCKQLKHKFYDKGEVIMQEGDIGDCVYFIINGKVGIYKGKTKVNTLGPPHSIGEKALETDCTRTATIKALVPTNCLILTREEYASSVLSHKATEKIQIVEFLKQVEFFKALQRGKLEGLAWGIQTSKYHKGQLVYSQGDHPSHAFIVKRGSVEINAFVTLTHKARIPRFKHKEEFLVNTKNYIQLIRKCRPGEVFGEQELFPLQTRKLQATSSSENTLLLIVPIDSLNQNLSDKDKNDLVNMHSARPTTQSLKKKLSKDLFLKHRKYKAILEAADVSPMPYGRFFPERRTKKEELAKQITSLHNRELSRNLLKSRFSITHK